MKYAQRMAHLDLTSEEWVSGDPSNVVAWNTTTASSTIFHSGSRQDKDSMTETSGIAEDSTVYYAMAAVSDSLLVSS